MPAQNMGSFNKNPLGLRATSGGSTYTNVSDTFSVPMISTPFTDRYTRTTLGATNKTISKIKAKSLKFL
jgi:hypothetical protein